MFIIYLFIYSDFKTIAIGASKGEHSQRCSRQSPSLMSPLFSSVLGHTPFLLWLSPPAWSHSSPPLLGYTKRKSNHREDFQSSHGLQGFHHSLGLGAWVLDHSGSSLAGFSTEVKAPIVVVPSFGIGREPGSILPTRL